MKWKKNLKIWKKKKKKGNQKLLAAAKNILTATNVKNCQLCRDYSLQRICLSLQRKLQTAQIPEATRCSEKDPCCNENLKLPASCAPLAAAKGVSLRCSECSSININFSAENIIRPPPTLFHPFSLLNTLHPSPKIPIPNHQNLQKHDFFFL